jgi:hypothetical protein
MGNKWNSINEITLDGDAKGIKRSGQKQKI